MPCVCASGTAGTSPKWAKSSLIISTTPRCPTTATRAATAAAQIVMKMGVRTAAKVTDLSDILPEEVEKEVASLAVPLIIAT